MNKSPTIDTSAAAAALSDLASGPAQDASHAIGEAFATAGKRIASSLETAARTGELSVSRLARSILKDLSSIAFDRFVTAPLNAAIGSVFKLPVSGARASGGPVTAGGAYLVGERGPELFVPGEGGVIESGVGGGPVHVTINMPAGSSLNDARRSSAQIATALARAVQRGARGA
ncbi:MAG: hypothetical protein MUF14_06560 [Hyphomonadaceae bacterium]|nr:hypothetical protein [Hyphomonadaceae bacterium]